MPRYVYGVQGGRTNKPSDDNALRKFLKKLSPLSFTTKSPTIKYPCIDTKMSAVTKTQPWKQFPRGFAAVGVEQTPEEMNMQRSYGTHASNTKGRIFTIEDKPKTQPWKLHWPAQSDEVEELSEEELNMQRSYGTHASNTKGRIFTIENKPC